MVLPASRFMTPEEYLAFEKDAPDKHEYTGGSIYAMAGASIAHNFIVSNLIREIGTFLVGKGCDVLPSDVRISIPGFDSYVYPDVTIFCGELEKDPVDPETLTNPSVIIEVLSKSTRGVDKGTKLFKYLQLPSLLEYILVDADEYCVQTVIKQDDHTFKINYTIGIDTTLLINPIHMQLPLKDIYYKVPLEGRK